MKQIYKLLVLLLIFSACALKGQQNPRFTHFLFNESAFNPAMAGVNDREIFLYHRQQWSGLDDGSFSSQLLGASFRPFGKSSRIGLGILLNADQAHIIKNGNYGMTFAYRILNGGEDLPHTLSIGVMGGVITNRLAYESAQINNPFDITFFDQNVSELVFNYGMGITYQGKIGEGTLSINAASNQSANDLMFDNPETGFLYGLKRNLVAQARFSYPLNDDISLEPALMYRRLLANSTLKDDIVVGMRGNFKGTVSGGVTYATVSNSVGVVLGINLGKGQTSGAFEMPMGVGADLGMTYELGILVQPGRKDKKQDPIAQTPTPGRDSLTLAEEKEILESEEITRLQLIRKLQKVEDRPFNVNIEVRKNGKKTVVIYRLVNLFSAYVNVPKIENFIDHLSQLNEEWVEKGYKNRQTLLTSRTYENEAIMNAVIDMKYEGEFGPINNVPYRYNDQATNISLGDDLLTIKEREFLKLYRFVSSLRSHTDQISMNIKSRQSVFETVIEFRLEK